MQIRLLEVRAQHGEGGRPLSLRAVSEGTGIDLRTLENISAGNIKTLRLEYVDALCKFLRCTTGDLLTVEDIDLPLDLNLRPDRRGKPVRQASDRGGVETGDRE